MVYRPTHPEFGHVGLITRTPPETSKFIQTGLSNYPRYGKLIEALTKEMHDPNAARITASLWLLRVYTDIPDPFTRQGLRRIMTGELRQRNEIKTGWNTTWGQQIKHAKVEQRMNEEKLKLWNYYMLKHTEQVLGEPLTYPKLAVIFYPYLLWGGPFKESSDILLISADEQIIPPELATYLYNEVFNLPSILDSYTYIRFFAWSKADRQRFVQQFGGIPINKRIKILAADFNAIVSWLIQGIPEPENIDISLPGEWKSQLDQAITRLFKSQTPYAKVVIKWPVTFSDVENAIRRYEENPLYPGENL